MFNGSIVDIVPHDPPMVLLDRYVNSVEGGLEAEVHISETSPFYIAERGVPAYVGIEYIAQAISAYNGLSDYLSGLEVNPGFLLGSRKVDFKCDYFPKGSILDISVNLSFSGGGMAVFDGTIKIDGQIVVSGRINAYQPEDPAQTIQAAKEE